MELTASRQLLLLVVQRAIYGEGIERAKRTRITITCSGSTIVGKRTRGTDSKGVGHEMLGVDPANHLLCTPWSNTVGAQSKWCTLAFDLEDFIDK